MNRTRAAIAVLAFALIAGGGTARAEQPFLFGAYTGETVAEFEAMIGHTITLDVGFQTFSEMPRVGIVQDVQAGRIPLISWTSKDADGASVLAQDILGGKYDQQLDAQADAIAALGGKILIEWQSEMTDNKRNALFMAGVPEDQWGATYVAVWIYMHDIFVARGATNAQWVWSPGGKAYETSKNGTIACQSYFPGTAYVDWMGFHTYNKSGTPMAYDANPDFLAFYAEAPLWAPGLPLIHSQTGATNTTQAQAEWIETAQTSLKTEFPLVRGFGWFNVDEGPINYMLSGQGFTAFSAMAADPYFQ